MSSGASIVMPVHGRAALTKRCLDRLLARLPAGCEVIVVDDASADWTPALLDRYGDAIRVVRMADNRGYGHACNEGAAAAVHDTLLFLNNDTEPLPGWLEAMISYAKCRPALAVVGAKLLYPTGAVQHAGVAIGQDGYPHNLYAGLPAEHPAVNRSRRLQAVTGACMLVSRAPFEAVGGFDTEYANSLEDVDLCLRIGEWGAEVHYCHEAVLIHLESASRGRDDRFERSVKRWRERWRGRVLRDDLAIYAEDGLLEVEYGDAYPLRLSISPLLASLGGDRQPEIEGLLEGYAAQVSDLMAEVVRLTALAGDQMAMPATVRSQRPAAGPMRAAVAAALDHRMFLKEANRLEEQVRSLQRLLEDAGAPHEEGTPPFKASRSLGYRHLVERVRAAVAAAIPPRSRVLVVSRGDRELLKLSEGTAGHFPQHQSGSYLGYHPRDSAEAIAHLEDLRNGGADYLVVPSTSYWWLDHYAGFAKHLRERYPVKELEVCSIFMLRDGAAVVQEATSVVQEVTKKVAQETAR